MEEEIIAQTKFDQLISDDQSCSPKQENSQTPWHYSAADSLICRSAVLLFPVLPNFWMIFGNSAMAEAAGSLIRSATFLS